jgi:Zinc finger, C3HC4 type (RING finger)
MAPHDIDISKEHIHHNVKEKERKTKNVTKSNRSKASYGFQTPTTPSSHPRSPLRSPRLFLANVYHNTTTPVSAGTNSGRSINMESLTLHKEIEMAIQTYQWESVRIRLLQLSQNSNTSLSIEPLDSSERKGSRVSFWSRISGLRSPGANHQSTRSINSHDKSGLLSMDDQQRTPLHLVVSCRKVPLEIVQSMITLETRAVSIPNSRGRLPLHFAIVHRAEISVIAALIDVFPAAISFPDSKGQSPLQYAVDIAKRDSIKGPQAPRTYWMPLPDYCDEAIWQQEQNERWSVVHWLLLSSATHLQTSLSVGGRKPILVESLLYAASPAVISLLIGASVMLLSYEKKATAFAASTLYTCVTRHYPLSILMSLANQCPSDVHKVRDETGMGLVSAQFISACFEQVADTQEWCLSEDFYACFTECIQVGEIGDDPAMTDWWSKIEYLIAFCACSKLNRSGFKAGRRKNNVIKRFDPNNFPSEYLLHAALMNEDTPPPVIRLLLALYPESIKLEDPRTGAFPLHLIANTREYIPRYYEVYSTDYDSKMKIILDADPSAILKRHESSLPLQYAITCGRTITSILSLLDATTSHSLDSQEFTNQPPLLQRDPKTGLYPFQLAASYPNSSDEDSLRWTSLARNKFSNSAWKALSDREKASTILRVADLEDIARIDTIYELLRRQPEAICRGQIHSQQKYSPRRTVHSDKDSGSLLSRDSTGRGIVADHYISWCYSMKLGKAREEIYEENSINQNVLRQAIKDIKRTGNLYVAPRNVQIWWDQLLKYMRQWFLVEKRQHESNWMNIPCDKSEYLLHIALTNSDTPPQVVEMMIALCPKATAMSIPGSSLLPLHIATQTSSYTPRQFERYKHSSLSLVLSAYPEAAKVKNDDRLPLHFAISSGKSYQEIEMLMLAEPCTLKVMDCDTGLYPFQLMASCTTYTSIQRSRFLYVARNKFDDKSWNQLSPQLRTKQVVQVQKEHDLEILSTIFLLLRNDLSAFDQENPTGKNEENRTFLPHRFKSFCSLRTLKSKGSDLSNTNRTQSEHSSFAAKADEVTSPINLAKNPLPLMLLLSQHRPRHTPRNEEMFECDATIMSNIDVLSSLTSTVHTAKKSERRDGRNDEDDASNESERYNRDHYSSDDTSYDDFAEDSFVRISPFSESNKSISRKSGRVYTASESNTLSDTEHIVYFELRRAPRGSSGKVADGLDGNRSSIKLIKRPEHLTEMKSHSLLHSLHHEKQSTNGSIQSNSTSLHTSSTKHCYSYKSLRSDEKRRMRTRAEMEWVSPNLLKKADLGQHNEKRDDDTDHYSLSLSLPSSHPQFTPTIQLSSMHPTSIGTDSIQKPREENSSKNISPVGNSLVTDVPGKGMPPQQASLLGTFCDVDHEDDDLLLNLGPTHSDRNVRSSSDHYISSTKKRLVLEKQKENVESLRKSQSEHVNATKTQLNPVRDHKPTRDSRGKTLLTHSNTAIVLKSETHRIASSAPDAVVNESPNFTCGGDKSITEQDSNDKKILIAPSGSRKYFDKASMSWKEHLEPSKQDKFFDKVTFRWVVSEVILDVSGKLTPQENSTKVPQQDIVFNPFELNMRKSKAAQISKTERHLDVTQQKRRTKFNGTSSRRLGRRRSSVRMDQMVSLMNSSRNLLCCIVCKENERKVLLVPCRHLCLCQSCSSLQKTIVNCPLCACAVTGRMLIA